MFIFKFFLIFILIWYISKQQTLEKEVEKIKRPIIFLVSIKYMTFQIIHNYDLSTISFWSRWKVFAIKDFFFLNNLIQSLWILQKIIFQIFLYGIYIIKIVIAKKIL